MSNRPGSALATPTLAPMAPAVPSQAGVVCASYARYSSDLQREESIADQQRECRQKAVTLGLVIAPGLEFADEAVSGTKAQREGLDKLLASAARGDFQVLFMHSLSRLGREVVLVLPIIKDLVHNHRVRVVVSAEGIDTDVLGWEMHVHLMSMIHEQQLKGLAVNVLRGQEGVVLARLSVGDLCYGYSSEAVGEESTVGRGRHAKPHRRYVINEDEAQWVKRIFGWFIRERRSVCWIVKELNRLKAPKSRKAKTRRWGRPQVAHILRNPKYVGIWSWGQRKNHRNPLTGVVRQELRSPEEIAQWTRDFPELRLVDDETFQAAQQLFAENARVHAARRSRSGRLTGASRGANRQHPRHLLSGLIRCAECGRTFVVGGVGGKYLMCSNARNGSCTCRTQLPRALAERLLLDLIATRILTDSAWRAGVLEECQRRWQEHEAHLPAEIAALARAEAEAERKISQMLDCVENGNAPADVLKRLAERRAEQRKLAGRLKRLQTRAERARPAPTHEWVDNELTRLVEILRSQTPAACHTLRRLVGGEILVTEIRKANRKRYYLQGRFRLSARPVDQSVADPEGNDFDSAPLSDDFGQEIVLDFRRPTEFEALAEEAKALYDQGLLHLEIAQKLRRGKSYVTKLIAHWFRSRGLAVPDGRARRHGLASQQKKPPRYQQIADEVMKLYHQDRLLGDIAATLDLDRNTVTASIRWWYERRGLPVPDGRTRRKSLVVKTSPRAAAALEPVAPNSFAPCFLPDQAIPPAPIA